MADERKDEPAYGRPLDPRDMERGRAGDNAPQDGPDGGGPMPEGRGGQDAAVTHEPPPQPDPATRSAEQGRPGDDIPSNIVAQTRAGE